MKKILRGAGGLFGIILLVLVGLLGGARRGAEPEWWLFTVQNNSGGSPTWFAAVADVQAGEWIQTTPTTPNMDFLKTSPNGQWIYFTRKNRQHSQIGFDLYRIRWNATQPRRLGEMYFYHGLYLSPDGQWIAYFKPDHQLISGKSDGSHPRSISAELPTGARSILNIQFSSDGHWFIFGMSWEETAEVLDTYRIALEDRAAGLHLENLTYNVNEPVMPIRWLSANWVLVSSWDEENYIPQVFRLHLTDRALIPLTDARYQFAGWLPDDQLILMLNRDTHHLQAIRATDWRVVWEREAAEVWVTQTMPAWLWVVNPSGWQAIRASDAYTVDMPIPPRMTDLWEVWGESPDGEWLWLMYQNHESNQLGLWRLHIQDGTFEKMWEAPDSQPHLHGWGADGQRVIWSNTVTDWNTSLLTTTLYSMRADGQDLTTITTQPGQLKSAPLRLSDSDFSWAGLLIIGVVLVGSYFVKRGPS